MSEPSQSEERDELLLRRARAAGDAAAEREAITRLIAPYGDWGRAIAYGKIGEDIVDQCSLHIGVAREHGISRVSEQAG